MWPDDVGSLHDKKRALSPMYHLFWEYRISEIIWRNKHCFWADVVVYEYV